MQKKLVGRLVAAVLLSTVAGCQGADESQGAEPLNTQEAKAASECVERFQGISHCATGNASLYAGEEGLHVKNVTDPASDGVSANFGGAVAWARKSRVDTGNGQLDYTLAARDGEQVVSTLKVESGEAPGHIALSPQFTGTPGGSEYLVNVYRDGVLQGSTGGSPAARYVIIITIWGDAYLVDEFALMRHHLPLFWFSNGAAADDEGACVWRTRVGQGEFTINLDGQELVGDQIEFIEKIGAGHYPYTSFSGIDATVAKDFTIVNEAFIPADGADAR